MHYLTTYYKNLCESLEKQIKVVEKILADSRKNLQSGKVGGIYGGEEYGLPNVTSSLEMFVRDPSYFSIYPSGQIPAGSYVVNPNPLTGSPRPYTTRPSSVLSFNRDYYFPSGILQSLDSKNRHDTIAFGHEIAHDYQHAARMRDYFQKAMDRREVAPGYVFNNPEIPLPPGDRKNIEFLNKIDNQNYPDSQYFRRAFSSIPPERLSRSYSKNLDQNIDQAIRYSNYMVDPQEVNARGVGAAFVAKKEIQDNIKNFDNYARERGFDSFDAMPENEKINLKNHIRSHVFGQNFEPDSRYLRSMLGNMPEMQQYLSSAERSNQKKLAFNAVDNVKKDIARGIYMGEVEAQSKKPLSPEESERIERQKLIKQKIEDIQKKSAISRLGELQKKAYEYRPAMKVTSSAGQNLKNVSAAGIAAAGAIGTAALTQGVQVATDLLGMVGAPPTPKDRMQIEKDFQSDLGLGFDLNSEGELEMNPAGREAVRKRQQRGINFSSMFRQ